MKVTTSASQVTSDVKSIVFMELCRHRQKTEKTRFSRDIHLRLSVVTTMSE